MAAKVEKITLGIDVSKDTLEVYQWDSGQSRSISNDEAAIATWLRSFSGPVQVAVEPTSRYHLALVEQAHARGWAIYLINPRQLVHYRKAIGERNKTDAADAYLLARYLAHEGGQLRALEPHSKAAQQLWTLIKRRAEVVVVIGKLRQSLGSVVPARGAITALNKLVTRIDDRIVRLIEQLGWSEAYRRCLTIPGIGPCNGAALVAAFHRGAFASADAFVAYLGLDVRLRESGRYKGKRKLTKQGEPELRRLLWLAGKAGSAYAPFGAYRDAQIAKGLSKTAARVVLARKLARIAFAILRDGSTFRRQPMAA